MLTDSAPVLRGRRTPRLWTQLGSVVGGLLALGIITGIIPIPSLGAALEGLSDALGAWTYLLVPALAFFETAAFLGLIVPGETAVLVGGVVAERGEVSLLPLIAIVWAASVAGDVASFLLGRRLGGPFLRRHAGRLHVKVEHIERVERLFARHGGKTIVMGRFVGVLRAFTPFLAGTSGMTLRRFLPYSVGAALAWAGLFTALGYLFSNSVSAAGSLITQITLAAGIVVGLVVWVVRSHGADAALGRPMSRAPTGPADPTATR